MRGPGRPVPSRPLSRTGLSVTTVPAPRGPSRLARPHPPSQSEGRQRSLQATGRAGNEQAWRGAQEESTPGRSLAPAGTVNGRPAPVTKSPALPSSGTPRGSKAAMEGPDSSCWWAGRECWWLAGSDRPPCRHLSWGRAVRSVLPTGRLLEGRGRYCAARDAGPRIARYAREVEEQSRLEYSWGAPSSAWLFWCLPVKFMRPSGLGAPLVDAVRGRAGQVLCNLGACLSIVVMGPWMPAPRFLLPSTAPRPGC